MSSPRQHHAFALATLRGRAGLRAWLGVALVVLMLFSRLAVAAYVCPNLVGTDSGRAMTPCAEMVAYDQAQDQDQAQDPLQPLLCQQHCQWGQGEQTGSGQALSAAALPPAPLWVVLPAAAQDLSAQGPASVLAPAQERPPPAPLRTLLCCLRP